MHQLISGLTGSYVIRIYSSGKTGNVLNGVIYPPETLYPLPSHRAEQ